MWLDTEGLKLTPFYLTCLDDLPSHLMVVSHDQYGYSALNTITTTTTPTTITYPVVVAITTLVAMSVVVSVALVVIVCWARRGVEDLLEV